MPSVEAKIKRLQREVAEIDRAFYGTGEDGDRNGHLTMLERKRDDMIRAAVLQLHTATEEILDTLIMQRVFGTDRNRIRTMRGKSARTLRRMLVGRESIGFEMKLSLAVSLRIMTQRRRDRLAVLNTLRNKCSHNWLLKATVRRGRRLRQQKPPLLLYEGRDLHSVPVFKKFLAEYGPLYAKMFVETID